MRKDLKKRALHRAKIIEGQVKGLQKMIESEDYCVEILTQGLAVQRSAAALNKLVLENHLRTHVAHMLNSQNPATQEKAITELLGLYELSNIRGRY